MELMPLFWDFMLASLFRVRSPRLRQQIWQTYPKSTALRWALERCAEQAPSELVSYQRVKQMAAHLNPALLVQVAESLAPVGKPRPKELRDFEEAVLNLMDAHGQFKWLPEGGKDGPKRVTAPLAS
jgi:hypothetical protein